MSQLNIQMTPEFESNLHKYMAARGFRTKSEAIRYAVKEGLSNIPSPQGVDWSSLRGLGLGASQPRFQSNDSLWEKQ